MTMPYPALADLPPWAIGLITRYQTHKAELSTWIGISDWELHTNMGMLVFVTVAILFRRSLSSPWPLLAAIAAEAANEYLDRLAYGSWRWDDTSRDILFTLLWPMLLFLLARTGLIPRYP